MQWMEEKQIARIKKGIYYGLLYYIVWKNIVILSFRQTQ